MKMDTQHTWRKMAVHPSVIDNDQNFGHVSIKVEPNDSPQYIPGREIPPVANQIKTEPRDSPQSIPGWETPPVANQVKTEPRDNGSNDDQPSFSLGICRTENTLLESQLHGHLSDQTDNRVNGINSVQSELFMSNTCPQESSPNMFTIGPSLLESQLRGNLPYNTNCDKEIVPSVGNSALTVSSMDYFNSGNHYLPQNMSNAVTTSESRKCIMLEDLPSTSSTSNPELHSHRLGQTENSASADPFQFDTTNIQAIPLSQQASELQELGLRVFDQEEFEEGVMAQVDQALKTQEEERLKKLMERELKDVKEEAKSTQQELNRIDKALKLCQPNPTDKETKRRVMAIKQQRENKAKQLKKLKAKQKKLMMRVQGNADGLNDNVDVDGDDDDDELADMLGLSRPAQETEMERRIRMGEMTPFGNVVKPSGPRLSTPSEMSAFDKYLLDQGSKRIKAKGKVAKQGGTDIKKNKNTEKTVDEPSAKKSKIHKSKSAPMLQKPSSSVSDRKSKRTFSGGAGVSASKSSQAQKRVEGNFFDSKDKRSYRPSERDFSKWTTNRYKRRYPKFQHNFSGDPNISDYEDNDEDCYYDDADYVPDERDVRDSYIDEDDMDEHEGVRELTPRKRQIHQKGVGRISLSDNDVDYAPDSDTGNEADLKSIRAKFKKHSPRSRLSSGFRDDGDYNTFQKRIKAWKKEKLICKKEKIDQGEDESESEDDMEFEGGFKVPGKMWNKLYRYQQTGVQWLWELHNQQAGGIIGDEMGLGKTIQIIAFLTGLRCSRLPDRSTGVRYVGLGPTLIVVPTTVMHQWVKEFHTWWPQFRVGILHSSGSSTTSAGNLVQDIVESHGVLVTAYSTVVIKQEILLEHDWHYVILDEGHKIRNPDAQCTIACKQFRTCHRIILSGSPVQNNLKELWSLFDFVFPGKLGTLPDFMSNFSVPIVQGGYANATQVQVHTAYKCACVLRDTINPYLLRRMKSDVKSNLQLPNKNEQVLFCRLTKDQREVYQEYLDSKECDMILSGNFMVFPGLITLRKICNHPDISTGGPKMFGMIPEGYDEETVEYGHWKRSGKMVVVAALLKLWKKQGHRVLFFSQSKELLNIIESFVEKQSYTYMRMDGTTPISSRQPLITKFNNDSDIFIFLLTTRVGGLGVNLTGANRVVIYDPDWNPSTDTQARERAWRIGQKRQVTIYRLMTSGTIEEKIYHRQIFKQFLSNRVLKDPKQRRFFKSNDLFELFTLGDDDPKNSTETSAIFAGTGSDVKIKSKLKRKARALVKKKSDKPNRFDELHAKRKANETLVWDSEEEEVDNTTKFGTGGVEEAEKESGSETQESIHVGEDRMNKMREIARKLSLKIGRKDVDPPMEGDCRTSLIDCSVENNSDYTAGSSPSCSGAPDPDSAASATCKHVEHEKTEGKSGEGSCIISEKSRTDTKPGKRKEKKKKKKKDAKFEGERIANLHHVSAYKTDKDDPEEPKDHAHQDEYVLHRLFKKSGVHSAMQHDKIMMSSNPDFALVEAEAARVAKEAAKALKVSRARCSGALTGVPTWTGQSGVAGAPDAKKLRFGLKKNSRLLPTATAVKPDLPKPALVKQEASVKEEPVSKAAKHFDGSLAGNRKTAENGSSSAHTMLSSSDLLARMRARNHLTKTSSGQEQESSLVAEVDETCVEMITDIRNFVAFQARIDGQASSTELLEKFSSRLPHEDTANFKAMLKQVCTLEKRDGVGIWYLKPEFR